MLFRSHKSILIGEVKWENASNLVQIADQLDQKIVGVPSLVKNKKIYRAIFVKSKPFTEKSQADLVIQDASWVLQLRK